MAQARIVTDSTAELAPETVEELGITVVPLRVQIGAENLVDSPEYRSRAFHEANVRRKVAPTVRAPSVGEYREAYNRLAGETDDIVSIHTSTLPTDTERPAREAANSLLGRARIEVLDATFLSIAMGFIVEEAARAALQGAGGPEIVRLIRRIIPMTYLAFYVESVALLKRSGVLQPSTSTAATSAAKPILVLEEGVITPQFRVRNKGTAVERLTDFVAEFARVRRLAIIHSGLMPEVSDLIALVTERLGVESVRDTIYGPATAAAIGPKAVGAAVMER